jgi:hypothetical protein
MSLGRPLDPRPGSRAARAAFTAGPKPFRTIRRRRRYHSFSTERTCCSEWPGALLTHGRHAPHPRRPGRRRSRPRPVADRSAARAAAGDQHDFGCAALRRRPPGAGRLGRGAGRRGRAAEAAARAGRPCGGAAGCRVSFAGTCCAPGDDSGRQREHGASGRDAAAGACTCSAAGAAAGSVTAPSPAAACTCAAAPGSTAGSRGVTSVAVAAGCEGQSGSRPRARKARPAGSGLGPEPAGIR